MHYREPARRLGGRSRPGRSTACAVLCLVLLAEALFAPPSAAATAAPDLLLSADFEAGLGPWTSTDADPSEGNDTWGPSSARVGSGSASAWVAAEGAANLTTYETRLSENFNTGFPSTNWTAGDNDSANGTDTWGHSSVVASGFQPAGPVGSAWSAGSGTGSGTAELWNETFEGPWPGAGWAVGDNNASNGSDFWGEVPYGHRGSWSAWVAAGGNASGAETLFYEGFEGAFCDGCNGWSVGDSNLEDNRSYWDQVSASFGGHGAVAGAAKAYAAGAGYAGNSSSPQYVNNTDSYMSREVNLSGVTGAKLSFWHLMPSVEKNYDYGEVTVDGVRVAFFPDDVTEWTQVAVDLTQFAGLAVTLAWNFHSDFTVTKEGWYLDEIALEVTRLGPTPGPYPDGMDAYMSREVDLVNATAAQLEFYHTLAVQPGFDFAQVTVDGAVLANYSSNFSLWAQAVFDLTPYLGAVRTLSWRFHSDGDTGFAGWFVDDIRVTASSDSLANNLTGLYDNGMDAWMTTQANLSGLSTASLSFVDWLSVDECCDYGVLSLNGTEAARYQSSTIGDYWPYESVVLDGYVGGTLTLEWRFHSDGSGRRAGWFIDDVSVSGQQVEVRANAASALYDSGMNASLESPEFSLAGHLDANLSFWYWHDSETGYDHLYLEYMSGPEWIPLWQAPEPNGTGLVALDLPLNASRIRFRFTSDLSVTREGSYIDDLRLTAVPSPLLCPSAATPTSGAAPLAVAFAGNPSGGLPPYTVEWAFGDGGSSAAPNAVHQYPRGTYNATFTAADSHPAVSRCSSVVAVTARAFFPVTLVSDPPGQEVSADGVPLILPQTFLWPEGSLHNLSLSLFQNVTADSRQVFASWSDGGAMNRSFEVTGPASLIAHFATEYRVRLDTDPLGGMFVVDGTEVTAPYSAWWLAGSSHIVNVPSPQSIEGRALEFESWSDGASRSRQVGVVGPASFSATLRGAAAPSGAPLTLYAGAAAALAAVGAAAAFGLGRRRRTEAGDGSYPGGAAAGGAAAGAAGAGKRFLVEDVFLLYHDGRNMFVRGGLGADALDDPESVGVMLVAVQDFVHDSLRKGTALDRMGYGDNVVLIEKGASVLLAVTVFGEPDREFRDLMAETVRKFEASFAGIIEEWDGSKSALEGTEAILAPLWEGTAELTRGDVLLATTAREVQILSGVEFFQGSVRAKVAVVNNTSTVITGVTVDLDYNQDVLRLHRIEPPTYKIEAAKVKLGVLNTGEKATIAYYFDPQICTSSLIDGNCRYKDPDGKPHMVQMKTRKAEVVCPLFFTREQANTGMLRRLVETELNQYDVRGYSIGPGASAEDLDALFEALKSAVLAHDVVLVREFDTHAPFAAEAWFYGKTQVKGYQVVIRVAVDANKKRAEFFVASTVMRSITGLLAELNHTFQKVVGERLKSLEISELHDEALRSDYANPAAVAKMVEADTAKADGAAA